MKKALVEPSGRIAQVVGPVDIFPVASPLKWIDCEDVVIPDFYRLVDGNIISFPPPSPPLLLISVGRRMINEILADPKALAALKTALG